MANFLKIITLSIALVGLISCSDNAEQEMLHQAVAIEGSDECHLCGMLIKHFDGPKGEAFRKEQGSKVFKFCSTRDLFSYYLDPENKRNVSQMMVHDMSKMPWGSINDEHFIDAKTAWYVSGSSQKGAMGSTLASFSKETDAKAFAKEFGGNVLHFKDITIDVLL
ncbi:nitrous oxide reductase accessory protein NosL [Litorilituus lipolyticus]|uniref:Nitrous oxide reductase accessory protein NosL n=1 Tax=Litorilituus lipolyticus TaxID=2491017 RepID=A0A502L4U5_9GAMM|nr:nitrous oxide reductase accessory protein NosL [Litorilituus lipolyticus]TPH17321.1 nitrous oxide reductase accessory protein NosL [Litorilituus lipolyticus]